MKGRPGVMCRAAAMWGVVVLEARGGSWCVGGFANHLLEIGAAEKRSVGKMQCREKCGAALSNLAIFF